MIWADSGHGARPGAALLAPAGAQVVDLGAVEEFPLPAVDLAALVAMLSAVPVAEVSGAALVNGVAAWQQVLTMAQAAQATWVRELEARTPDALRHVPDELACVMVCTKRHAETVFLRAWGTAQHPALADAWAAGAIDTRKVDIILDEIHRSGSAVSAGQADAVVVDAIDRAREMTGPQLTRHVRAALIAASPAVAEERRTVERERRGVYLDLAPDAMARLIAYLPAADATAAFTAIDALAGHAGIDGDERTVDQRRADAFSDVFTSILDRQATPDGTPLPTRHGQRVALQVTVAASTLAGLDDAPAHLGSYGPIPAQLARELAQDATWRRVLTDPATGQVCSVGTQGYRPGADLTRTVQARDVTCTFPGCRQPATRCEIDHRVPYDAGRAARGGEQDAQTCEANLHALCKHHHQAKTDGWWNVTYDKETGVSRWTDRHGITTARHPVQVLVPPEALAHRRPPAARADFGDPPF